MLDTVKLETFIDRSDLHLADSGLSCLYDNGNTPIRLSHFKTATNGLRCFEGNFMGLRCTLIGNRFTLANSWHTALHGYNHTRMTVNDVFVYATSLIEAVPIIGTAKIKRLAYGVNVELDSRESYECWLGLKGKEPFPMTHRTKIYGKKLVQTLSHVKCYDKAFEVAEHHDIASGKNLVRFEIESLKMAYFKREVFKHKPIVFTDLLNPKLYHEMAQDLLNTLKQADFDDIDLTGLSVHQLNVVSRVKTKQVLSWMKSKHPRAYKDTLKEFRSICQNQQNSVKLSLIEAVENELLKVGAL